MYPAGDDATMFPAPPRIAPRLDRVRAAGHVTVWDATWPSAFEPHAASVRDGYLAFGNNHTARARMFLADTPRPAVLLVHGYMGGQWLIEERQWPIAWLVRKGFDVVLPVLPFHAARGDGGPPRFPGADPRYTNEGFRQAAHDLRGLVAFLRERGAPAVGVMGMSLGGYTTSLLATVEPTLAFAVPIIPLASIADFAREQGRFTGTPAQAEHQHAALERANWAVSPFARPPVLPPERVLVVAAEADRITPIAHAARLAAHFGAELLTIPGGHLLQVGRGDAFRAIARFWAGLGLLPPRRARR
jgi:pimeloyl-ACP methyl ester carboxylesterase